MAFRLATAALALAAAAASAEAKLVGRSKSKDDVRVSIHDNYVDFQGVDSLAFDLDHYSLSAGQPWDGVSVSGPGTVDVRAGRHGASGPAADFAAGITLLNAMGLKTAWPHLTFLPDDLNFVIFGNFTFNFTGGGSATCAGIRLGQGHHLTDNNWWIGDKSCVTVPDSHKFTCDLCHPAVDFFAGDDDHTFQVRLSDPPAE
eukprot:INCI4931.1.p2 GENE.INCI4931.1~~INCI4931.1.p2  ORF type:complete len:201 (-),score=33.74 INCI4931.1:135-737(-)